MPADPTSRRILITAGPTREYIDTVRYLSNDSSGKMGFALAEAAAARGHRVTLVHGPVSLPVPAGVRAVAVVSAAEMLAACVRTWPRQDALVMAAAVADYRPRRVRTSKMKKRKADLRLELEPTEDVLATLSAGRRAGQVVLGFALEDRSPRRNAASKLRRKGLDAIVLNRPAAIGADRSAVEVLVRGQPWKSLPRRQKASQARALIRILEGL